MTLLDRIRNLYRDKGLDALWHWAADAALKPKRNRFRALYKWALKRREADPGGGWYKRSRIYKRRWRRAARRLQEQQQAPSSCTTPGDPCWGGCRALTNETIVVVDGRASVTSRKRSYVPSGGSTTSDHLTTQTLADAVDFGIAGAYALRDEIARHFVGHTLVDYENAYFYRNGLRYRIQLIAGTHGTGPHLHAGFRRA